MGRWYRAVVVRGGVLAGTGRGPLQPSGQGPCPSKCVDGMGGGGQWRHRGSQCEGGGGGAEGTRPVGLRARGRWAPEQW